MKAAEPKINFHELQRIISVYSAFISAGLKEYHSKKLSIISKVKEENNFFEDLEEQIQLGDLSHVISVGDYVFSESDEDNPILPVPNRKKK